VARLFSLPDPVRTPIVERQTNCLMPAAIVVSVARGVVLSEAALTDASHEFCRASDQVLKRVRSQRGSHASRSNAGY
jgi:hypothetical protein